MIEITLPAMGEGIFEADITRWMVGEGTQVKADQPVAEVATDKVDNEIYAPASGIIHKILLTEGDTVKIGQVMALIRQSGIEGKDADNQRENQKPEEWEPVEKPDKESTPASRQASITTETSHDPGKGIPSGNYDKLAFSSPVIRKIAAENNITPEEIQQLEGSGTGGRITRADILAYLSTKESPAQMINREQVYGSGPSRVEEMDRMRKLIADHMVYSKQVAPHVTSFVESDVTEMIRWRNRVKEEFQKKYRQKLTVTTLILEAVIRALKEHPRINVSIDGHKIIYKQDINLGMAAALPDGNLIVPVIHNADTLNLEGLAAKVNDLADRARKNELKPAEIQGGTFTVTNLGQFGNISGTPIINQPQVAILAIGAITKKPAVVETPEGDNIGVRHILILSLAYDHRVVDGALGGTFLKDIGDKLEGFDPGREI